MYKSAVFAVCLLLLLAFSASAQTDAFLKAYQERLAENAPDVSFTIGFKNGQKAFRQGEMIPLELKFTSSAPDRYDFLNRTYDRSGRLHLDGFVIDRREKTFDPLYDYFFRSGGRAGGGIFSQPTLGSSPQIIDYVLNEFLSFKEAGKYRLYVASPRVLLKKKDPAAPRYGGEPVSLVSNVIEFEILPADEQWQAEKLAEAVRGECRILRYLGTKAAAREMLTRFGRGDKNCQFENYIGLYGSPERRYIVDEMTRMLVSPNFPVTTDFFQMLLSLDYFLSYPDPEKSESGFVGMGGKKQAAKENLIKLGYLEKFVRALPGKNADAYRESLETYFSFHARGENNPPAELTAALIKSFGSLSKKTQWMILENSLEKLETPAMLPVLQSIYSALEKTEPADYEFFYDRDLLNRSIYGIYKLDRDAGKQIILNEMRRPKLKVYTGTLMLLPKAEAPETENILLEKLSGDRIPADELESVLMLVDHYAAPKLLAKLRETYADQIEKMECGAQLEFLRVFLHSDLPFGEEMLGKAIATEAGKGCVGANLARVLDERWSAAIERTAASLLEDAGPLTIGNAAQLLGQNGSPETRDKLWKRLERFSREEQGKPDFGVRKRLSESWMTFMAEWHLVAALTESANWWFDRESIDRLSKLCAYEGCRERVEKLNKIFSEPARIESSVGDDDRLSFAVYQYKKLSFEALKKKLEQFPPNTALTWIPNPENPDDAKNFQEIKAFVQKLGMKLDK